MVESLLLRSTALLCRSRDQINCKKISVLPLQEIIVCLTQEQMCHEGADRTQIMIS